MVDMVPCVSDRRCPSFLDLTEGMRWNQSQLLRIPSTSTSSIQIVS
jgi:hypothetical protein